MVVVVLAYYYIDNYFSMQSLCISHRTFQDVLESIIGINGVGTGAPSIICEPLIP